ncbi:ABC transporter substrate-binding protein [Sphingomonas sp. R647]|uniref:ABC transporter substrate-binding protein n=1 Tax=Sphingomonas sp. R647 TaxID=2875233 RepID=UPI001CD403EA|nr:ABC transporter substrate-binding protein [Sphingomonas sp. R647]MCA1197419.1 ABC transporter substrate-binding protein [Sphingomonas sp. R647]
MRFPALPLAVALALIAGGCERRPDDVAVVVSAIGGPPELRDPTKVELGFTQSVLLGATAQGLVRFDAAGGVEPGIAERWIVTDGGRSYIFRLREAEWADGTRITAADVVASMRAAIAPRGRSALTPFVAVIDEVVEMTPQVVEVRLKHPRPDLLKLFAQPEFAILRRAKLAGTGPFRIVAPARAAPLLRPAIDPTQMPDEPIEPDPADDVRLYGERAAVALARFAARESDLILGGTFRDWPLLDHAGIAPANLRIDPAAGLFGLAIVSEEGFTADPANREALAMAIDRDALTARFRPEWSPVETVLPAQLDSASPPKAPDWFADPLDNRRQIARNRVAAWRAGNPDAPPTIRLAMPRSLGSKLLWYQVAADLRAIGLQPAWVDEREDADLRLIDAVAPYDSARWYLVTACRTCPEDLAAVIDAARDAPTLGERARRIAEADLALSAAHRYIPIAQPLRWSVAALRLRAFQTNPRAWHPLTHLREP